MQSKMKLLVITFSACGCDLQGCVPLLLCITLSLAYISTNHQPGFLYSKGILCPKFLFEIIRGQRRQMQRKFYFLPYFDLKLASDASRKPDNLKLHSPFLIKRRVMAAQTLATLCFLVFLKQKN